MDSGSTSRASQSSRNTCCLAPGPTTTPRIPRSGSTSSAAQLDLCNLAGVAQAADQLVNGTLDGACEDGQFCSLAGVRIPRLDAVVFNAGIGGWLGIDWPGPSSSF